ncbi:putative resolvase, N domain protein [Burkholderia pseudomallei MSHR7343]|nr:putative resolvase, N domain protein [Burkholderia pseudomallei MSHR7343]
MNSNTAICQRFDGCAYIHRVPAKAVEFRHDQYVSFLHLEE